MNAAIEVLSHTITSADDARLEGLAEYGLFDSTPLPDVVEIVILAAQLFDVPTAFVSMLGCDRQVFQAKVGLDLCETDRAVAFCSYTIAQPDTLAVLDAELDDRFSNNPLVTKPPHIRFYAGTHLKTPSGHVVGTLCLVDTKPHATFSEADDKSLRQMADLIMGRMELRRLEVARRASQLRFEHIASTSPDGIVCADERGRITFWNAAAERLFGYTAVEALGQSIELVRPESFRSELLNDLSNLANDESSRYVAKTIELPARHKDGTQFPIELSLSQWQQEGRVVYGSIMRDIRERRANEERLSRLAHLDTLTDLPNRAALRQRLTQVIEKGRSAAVLMLDLDGFKEINDGYGHAAGDAVLKTLAGRLLACVRPKDMVARLGGDEFILLLPDMGDPLQADGIAETVLATVVEPFEYEGQCLRLGTSVGIALAPAHGICVDELLSCADLALYRAKGDGGHCHRLFTPVLRQQAQRIRACRDELTRAVEHSEFVLFYQPQVRLRDGALVGAEALIRWRHPERGLLAPAAFLDVLEASRHSATVGDWVLKTACAQTARWRAAGASQFRIGVNLCGAQVQRGDLVETVVAALGNSDLPPAALELEITENIVLRHDSELIDALRALRTVGVGIAFDDYGTGYASLSLLKRFPLTRLKIDRSFVREMLASRADMTIVRTILKLGQGFGLAVIAEGIEAEAEHRRLTAMRCQEGQGYLFGKPMSADAFAARFGLWLEPGVRVETAA